MRNLTTWHQSMVIAAALFVANSFATAAEAQSCEDASASAAQELEIFLVKQLTYEVSKSSNELIAAWRTKYAAPDLLEEQWTDTGDIERTGLAAEQAELEYEAARSAKEDACDGG